MDDMIEISDLTFHSFCFNCSSCFEPLNEHIYVENNHVFCGDCYRDTLASVCGVCDKPIIQGEKKIIFNSAYHESCFNCSQCSVPLIDTDAKKWQDKLFCHKCYLESLANSKDVNCDFCHNKILGTVMRYIDNLGQMIATHASHLTCRYCSSPLDNTGIVTATSAICRRCYIVQDIKPCAGCKGILETRSVYFAGKHYHQEHFRCSKCGISLSKITPHENRGNPYCDECFAQYAVDKCATCGQINCTPQYKLLHKQWGRKHIRCYVCDLKLK
ncbi:MAG: LIM and senescent cell antigen-like-containing domain protein 2 [Paramarteilia canceri]